MQPASLWSTMGTDRLQSSILVICKHLVQGPPLGNAAILQAKRVQPLEMVSLDIMVIAGKIVSLHRMVQLIKTVQSFKMR